MEANNGFDENMTALEKTITAGKELIARIEQEIAAGLQPTDSIQKQLTWMKKAISDHEQQAPKLKEFHAKSKRIWDDYFAACPGEQAAWASHP
jgi:uncharacterized coiled-coil protein SlyX